jgi:hypothetical protein
MSSTIALMWDNLGLEAAVNVSDISKQRIWAALQGQDLNKVQAEPNLLHWQLRARFNPQRHYEIYIIEVEDEITVDDIVKAFNDAPQQMADTVRRIGHKFYSDRAEEDKIKIR